jgi:hypothetical protein
MHQLESFLLSLSNADADGRVLMSSTPPPPGSTEDKKPVITLKYLLLNPTDHFRDVVEQTRSVVLAGGTMEPVSYILCPSDDGRMSVLTISFFACRYRTSISSCSLKWTHPGSPTSHAVT